MFLAVVPKFKCAVMKSVGRKCLPESERNLAPRLIEIGAGRHTSAQRAAARSDDFALTKISNSERNS
jgi:hypothetical protein